MANLDRSDADRGLYRKFNVTRTDGSSAPGGRHEHCRYFVIDIDHDPNAPAALKAYAASCRAATPLLADDLEAIAAGVGTVRALEAITGQ